MDDPAAITFQTFDRIAAEALKSGAQPEPESDRERVEHFLMRTGRPVPNIIVLGRSLALRCRQIDELGGAATGVAGGESEIRLAEARYPGGQFQRGDPRDLPLDKNAFDGAWVGRVLAHFPRADVVNAMASIHTSLRPGGLLYVRLPVGDAEGFEDTGLGQIYRACWKPEQFTLAIGALDFDLLESSASGDEQAMIFRREY